IMDRTVVLLLAMVGAAVGLQEVLGVFAAWSVGMGFHPLIALLHFSWPRFYNDVQSWSMPVIVAMPVLFPGKPLANVFCVAALVLEWYVVIATGARGSMLGVSVAVLAAILVIPSIRKTLMQYQFAGLVGGVMLYALVVAGHHQFVGVGPTASETGSITTAQAFDDGSGNFTAALTADRMWTSSGRIDMWRGAMGDVKAHPLLGIGPMNYACQGPVYRAGHPHNFPLQFMSEWGVPSSLLLIPVLGFLLFSLLHRLRTPEEPGDPKVKLAGFLATGVFAAAINSCFSGVLMGPASQVTGVLVSGCLLGLVSTPLQLVSARKGGTVVLAAALIVSLLFLVFAREEITVSELRFEQTPVMDRAIPRFWQNGKVCVLYQKAS
ncbi:MAG: O-antigen ligase family protein, partial [Lysobacterales bacterium]